MLPIAGNQTVWAILLFGCDHEYFILPHYIQLIGENTEDCVFAWFVSESFQIAHWSPHNCDTENVMNTNEY